MKLFVDSANLSEIDECLKRGFVSGITTNPSILAKEDHVELKSHIRSIIDLIRSYDLHLSLSVELLTTEPDEMLKQAERFLAEFGDYTPLAIKVPIGWDELRVIRELRRMGANVNCTCCMSFNQAIIAADAGATFVSVFWGRIRDTGYDAASVVRQIRETLDARGSHTQVIVGSIRQMMDVNEAIIAGTDIVTVPPKFFPMMCSHPKTDEAVQQFMRDSQNFRVAEPTPVPAAFS